MCPLSPRQYADHNVLAKREGICGRHKTGAIIKHHKQLFIPVVLNSQSDNSHISAMSGSGSDSVSSNCVFCLLVCLVIFLGSQMSYTG